jgi:proline iminopeptidase
MARARSLLLPFLLAGIMACEAPRNPAPGEGYVAVPGGRVWYQVVGEGPGTPVVVLHGGPGAPSYYMSSLARLGEDRPVVFYDQLGAGRSDMPSDTTLWRIERFMAELDSVRAHLGLEKIHLLGHSWGTMLATDYVLGGAKGVRSLVLASPALSTELWKRDADALIATLPDSVREAIRTHEEAGTYEDPAFQAAMMDFYGRYVTLRWGPDVDSTFAHFGAELYGYMWGPSEFTPTGTLRSYDRTDRLGELALPVLYTAGEFDEARPETVRYFQSLTPGAELAIIPGSAHLTTVDAPEAFADTISRFLRTVETP